MSMISNKVLFKNREEENRKDNLNPPAHKNLKISRSGILKYAADLFLKIAELYPLIPPSQTSRPLESTLLSAKYSFQNCPYAWGFSITLVLCNLHKYFCVFWRPFNTRADFFPDIVFCFQLPLVFDIVQCPSHIKKWETKDEKKEVFIIQLFLVKWSSWLGTKAIIVLEKMRFRYIWRAGYRVNNVKIAYLILCFVCSLLCTYQSWLRLYINNSSIDLVIGTL